VSCLGLAGSDELSDARMMRICSFVVAATTEIVFVRRNQRGRPTDELTDVCSFAAASVSGLQLLQVKNVKYLAASGKTGEKILKNFI